ncbi:MAG TPA: thiamine pyrophosphate-dependent enzyme, partial [Halomonas sp.]|nr:thiamine pyrophosphate-dependent enzyme [Halomonas sp.]
VSDAARALEGLLAHVPSALKRGGAARAAEAREALALHEDPLLAPFVPLCTTVREALPDAIWVGDSTAPAYAANHLLSLPAPRCFFNASTGYGTLGYGLPAALGAQLGQPERPVIGLVGDGGVMLSFSELATAVEEHLPVVILLWHNHGYEEIRRYMDAHGVERLGVDIQAPDFQVLAQGFGCAATRVTSPAELGQALRTRPAQAPYLIEIDAAAWCRQLGLPASTAAEAS